MNERLKDYLTVSIIITILIVAFSAAGYVYSYSRSIDPSGYRSFSVNGDGKAVGIPNVAEFSFSVITEGGKQIADLQKENIDKTNSAINFMKSNGVADADIKTESYNLAPKYQYARCGNPTPPTTPDGDIPNYVCPPPQIVGYTITQTVTVKVRDFDKIGSLLSGAVSNGANTVSSLEFKIDDPTEVENEARTIAISKAQQKAVAIARAGGFRLGRLLSIEEGFTPVYPYLAREKSIGMGGAMDMAVPAPAPSIQPGSQEVRIDVTLRFEIR